MSDKEKSELPAVEAAAMAIANEMHKDGDYGLDGKTAYEHRQKEFIALARARRYAPMRAVRAVESLNDAKISHAGCGRARASANARRRNRRCGS